MSVPQKRGLNASSDAETSSDVKPTIAADDPLVVVAIVSTNDIHNILGCLTSLTTSTHRNFRIVICENGGPAAFEHATKSLAGASFMREDKVPRRGVSSIGRTQGYSDFYLADGKQPVTLLKRDKNFLDMPVA